MSAQFLMWRRKFRVRIRYGLYQVGGADQGLLESLGQMG
jgi:hypothetical protein